MRSSLTESTKADDNANGVASAAKFFLHFAEYPLDHENTCWAKADSEPRRGLRMSDKVLQPFLPVQTRFITIQQLLRKILKNQG